MTSYLRVWFKSTVKTSLEGSLSVNVSAVLLTVAGCTDVGSPVCVYVESCCSSLFLLPRLCLLLLLPMLLLLLLLPPTDVGGSWFDCAQQADAA